MQICKTLFSIYNQNKVFYVSRAIFKLVRRMVWLVRCCTSSWGVWGLRVDFTSHEVKTKLNQRLTSHPKIIPSLHLTRYKTKLNQRLTSIKTIPFLHLTSIKPIPFLHFTSIKTIPSQRLTSIKTIPSQRLTRVKTIPSWHLTSIKTIPSWHLTSIKTIPSWHLTSIKTIPSCHHTVSIPYHLVICLTHRSSIKDIRYGVYREMTHRSPIKEIRYEVILSSVNHTKMVWFQSLVSFRCPFTIGCV